MALKVDIVFSKIYKRVLRKKIVNYTKKAIDARNEVVHDGKRVLNGDINKYLNSIEKVINTLNS